MTRFLFTCALALSLALPGCATVQRTAATVQNAIDMANSVRSTVSQVLDRPAPLANTQRDEALIRDAYTRFDQGLSIIESLVDRGVITAGSANALRIATGIDIVKRELRRAYTAQQALNTGTVRDALAVAQRELGSLITNLQQEQ